MGMREAGQQNQRWYRRTERGARGPICAFMPLATIFLCQLIMLQSVPAAWEWMLSQPWSTVVTYVTLLLVQILLERLPTSLLAGVLCVMAPCMLLSVASYLKLAVNGVPLLFSDLAMIGQAAQIAGFLGPDADIGRGTWTAIVIALGLLFLVFLWNRPVIRVPWWQRLLTAGGWRWPWWWSSPCLPPVRCWMTGTGGRARPSGTTGWGFWPVCTPPPGTTFWWSLTSITRTT